MRLAPFLLGSQTTGLASTNILRRDTLGSWRTGRGIWGGLSLNPGRPFLKEMKPLCSQLRMAYERDYVPFDEDLRMAWRFGADGKEEESGRTNCPTEIGDVRA